jgi:NAD(P)-dependent dehydrogenase (short-subunit alcohol dehydrogenase family)
VNLDGRTVAITGAAGGIGRALGVRCAAAGARVVATDLDDNRLGPVRDELADGHLVVAADVTDEQQLRALLDRAGTVDVFVANAGVAVGGNPVETPDEVWDLAFAVNVRAHVLAARLLLPAWTERGEGYFVSVASAAGLLTQIGSAPYSVSKHAAVAFAEWLSITYGDKGVRVSCVCPMGVRTAMLDVGEAGALEALGSRVVHDAGAVLDPDDVAAQIVDGIAEERFLVLPHPEVLTYFQRKAADYDRWLAGMRKLQASAEQSVAEEVRI